MCTDPCIEGLVQWGVICPQWQDPGTNKAMKLQAVTADAHRPSHTHTAAMYLQACTISGLYAGWHVVGMLTWPTSTAVGYLIRGGQRATVHGPPYPSKATSSILSVYMGMLLVTGTEVSTISCAHDRNLHTTWQTTCYMLMSVMIIMETHGVPPKSIRYACGVHLGCQHQAWPLADNVQQGVVEDDENCDCACQEVISELPVPVYMTFLDMVLW